MPSPVTPTTVGALTPHLFVPTLERPVRAKQHRLSPHTRIIPHRHRWAQISVSLNGALHLTSPQGTLIAPPSHAVWIPAGPRHSVAMVEAMASSEWTRASIPPAAHRPFGIDSTRLASTIAMFGVSA